MIDHTGFAVSDLSRARFFYAAALRPLGIGLLMELTAEETGAGAHAGFGIAGNPFFWIGDHGAPSSGMHIAFTAENRAQVDASYDAALKAGGRDNGVRVPGLTITQTTMARLSSTPTATTSRPFAMGPGEERCGSLTKNAD